MNIKDISLFSNLDENICNSLKKQIIKKKFSKKSILFYEGEKSDYLYLLLDGTVKLYMTAPNGTQVQIHRLSAPNTIGEYIFFKKTPFPVTCEFATDGYIGFLHFDELYQYMNNKDFTLGVIASLTDKIMLLSSLIRQETIFSAEAKVADFLLTKIDIFNKLKYIEIATILNISPETFSRILTKFKNKKIIATKDNELFLLEREMLKMIIETNSIKSCLECMKKCKK